MALKPTDSVLKEEVRRVLLAAGRHARFGRSFLTAHQILSRLTTTMRERLVDERELGGRGGGVQYSAASVVSECAERLGPEVEVVWLDTGGLSLHVADQSIPPGADKIALYRLKDTAPASA
jgi:hypothetical protein